MQNINQGLPTYRGGKRSLSARQLLLFLLGFPAALLVEWIVWATILSDKVTPISRLYHPVNALSAQCAAFPSCPFPAEAVATLYVLQNTTAMIALILTHFYLAKAFDNPRLLRPHWLVIVMWTIGFLDFYFGLFDDGMQKSSSNSIAHSSIGQFHFFGYYCMLWPITFAFSLAQNNRSS